MKQKALYLVGYADVHMHTCVHTVNKCNNFFKILDWPGAQSKKGERESQRSHQAVLGVVLHISTVMFRESCSHSVGISECVWPLLRRLKCRVQAVCVWHAQGPGFHHQHCLNQAQ